MRRVLARPNVSLRRLAVAAGATVLLAGCGGQAQEVRDAGAYAARVNAVQSRFERDLAALNRTVEAASEREDVTRAAVTLQRRIDGVEQELRGIRPPEAVATPHRELISAFERWQAPLRAFRRSLRDRDLQAALRAKVRFDTETQAVEERVNEARRRINDGLRSLAD